MPSSQLPFHATAEFLIKYKVIVHAESFILAGKIASPIRYRSGQLALIRDLCRRPDVKRNFTVTLEPTGL